MVSNTDMVILANSIKHHGACVAGTLCDKGRVRRRWVRPVMDAHAGTLPVFRTCCGNGRLAQVLDVVSIPLGEDAPMLHQRENRLLSSGLWQHLGRASWRDLEAVAEADQGLWIDGFSSTKGLNDHVPEILLDEVDASLKLVRVASARLYWSGDLYGNRRIRAAFRLGARRYDLAVTDPLASAMLGARPEIEVAEAYFCISLGVPFRQGAYKLVASVITPDRAGVK